MSFPAYPSYAETNLDWCSELPSHWTTRRLKTLFVLMKRAPEQDDKIVTAFRDGQVTLRERRREEGFTNALQEIGYQRILPGDLVIHAMDGFAGAIGVSDSAGKATPVYSVCTPTSDADAHYFALLLRHMALSGFVAALAKGVRERSTDFRWGDASVLNLPYPPPSEQAAIVAFVNRETTKIDALVAEQRRLVELLKEKRETLISHAVTKGLNSNAPMKDSGVDWLGDVPTHWEMVAIKRLVRLQSGESLTSEDIEPEGAFPVYGGNGLRGYRDKFTHDGDYVLIGRQGALCGNINYASGRFWASEHALVAHPRGSFVIRWFGELLRTMNLGRYSTSAAQPGLSAEVIGNLCIPLPPADEQSAIARLVERTEQSIDPLLIAAELAETYLQERRAALISAAVTGKIDVRGAVARQEEAA